MNIRKLEHCYDINNVMNKYSKYSKNKSVIVLEEEVDLRVRQKIFNFNHHRIFTHNSFELLLLKHGWMLYFQHLKIYRPTRPKTIFTIELKMTK